MADQQWTVPPLSDLMEVDTQWGRMPLWKCRAMSLAYTQRAIADAADDQPQTPADPKDAPPPLAADADASFTGGGFEVARAGLWEEEGRCCA
jgi:hypothetical protein